MQKINDHDSKAIPQLSIVSTLSSQALSISFSPFYLFLSLGQRGINGHNRDMESTRCTGCTCHTSRTRCTRCTGTR